MMNLWLLAYALLIASVNASPHPLRRQESPTSVWPIKTGYVAFGDSYAAGMGTGVTSGDSCRVGSNNFGRLLNTWTSNPNVEYQELVCSGDTTVGLNRQIDAWANPGNADLATVSMGGNDLEFSDLLWYCVLTPNPLAIDNPRNCDNTKDMARNLMSDETENGLAAKLQAAYTKVMQKSGRDDFHLYVTSYPTFFNVDDATCDKTTFYYLSPQYNPSYDPRKVMLTTELREELNGLVDNLNIVIDAAVSAANAAGGYMYERIHFVDVAGPWASGGHEWCQPGVQEPMESRSDTWFFLSAWNDVPIDDPVVVANISATEAAIEQAQVESYINAGSIPLPDASTCQSTLGTDPDPWAVWMCRAAQDMAAEPNGTWATNYKAANAQVAAKNATADDVSWYVPTRQAKTFHPRSPGMLLYRDQLISAINKWQGATRPTSGTCAMNVTEYWGCEPVDVNLSAFIDIIAPNGSSVYQTVMSADGPPGEPINANDPNTVQTSFGNVTIVGEHVNDYIQFTSGASMWRSDTTAGPASCNLLGADWNEDGPQCPGPEIQRTFGCFYPCSLT